MFLIVAAAAISNLFGLEIITYYIYTGIIIFTILFNEAMLPLFPIPCVAYMTFAKRNNPLSVEKTSTFLHNSSAIHMLIIGITISIFVIPRIIHDIVKNKDRRKMPKLLYGFIALGLSYILGGIFSKAYGFRTAFFGLVEILTLSFTYFCFYFTVDWKKVDKNYFPLLFTTIGFLMVVEVLNMLIEGGFFSTIGEFSRGNLYTGWGHYNNVGGICVLTIPAPFYFACTKKNGFLYSLIGTLFLLFTILTQSRNSMLMGSIIYCICALITLIKSEKKEKIKHLITYSILLTSIIVIMILFKERIMDMFSSIYNVGTDDNGRIEIYKDGLTQFKDYPIFGNGFYECKAFQWGVTTENTFIPPRYHNTYIQILASCGIVGIITYLYHRYQTIKLFYKNKDLNSIFIMITLLGLILIGFLDCHFHNLGPGFIYSALLLLAEKVYYKKDTL